MKLTLIVLFVAFGLSLAQSELSGKKDETSVNQKGAVDFGNMVLCVFGGNSSIDFILSYGLFVGYGCYCGYGAAPVAPLDEIDKCCKAHDECYDTVLTTGSWLSVYALPYDNTCENRIISCTGTVGSTSRRTCECDRIASECFYANRSFYNATMKDAIDNGLCNGHARRNVLANPFLAVLFCVIMTKMLW